MLVQKEQGAAEASVDRDHRARLSRRTVDADIGRQSDRVNWPEVPGFVGIGTGLHNDLIAGSEFGVVSVALGGIEQRAGIRLEAFGARLGVSPGRGVANRGRGFGRAEERRGQECQRERRSTQRTTSFRPSVPRDLDARNYGPASASVQSVLSLSVGHPSTHASARRPTSASRVVGMRVLFIGDVVGSPGRRGLRESMPALRERHAPDLVIVNGENSAGGVGITPRTARDIFEAGAGVITTGNHVYRHREVYGFLDTEERVVRPANYPGANPGRGHTVVEAGGMRVAVVNLSGAAGLRVARSPFDAADAVLEQIEADAVVVDFHAEMTSEKVAMGWHLDGRAAAVLGTHTHVPTADGRVLPGGTAYISDVGMTGSRTSVLGVKPEQALTSFITQMPTRFETAEEDVWVMGAVVEVNPRGLADSIEQVMVPAPDPGS
jgi:2',3'-cyclic-nucleotide 2'-phosphodiesterase